MCKPLENLNTVGFSAGESGFCAWLSKFANTTFKYLLFVYVETLHTISSRRDSMQYMNTFLNLK